MTSLSVDLLTLSRAIAVNVNPRLTVEGLTLAERAGRAELLVAVTGCHDEPCVLAFWMERFDSNGVGRRLREQLVTALQMHAAS